jgi:predicted acetyltransferase
MQRRTHGMSLFDYPDVENFERYNTWQVCAIVGGKPVGMMLYKLEGEAVTQLTFKVIRFYYHTSLGRYLLLSWIAQHIDQANVVEMWLPPYEVPETWISDLKVEKHSVERAPMGRIVDVNLLNGVPCGNGRFSALLTDPICSWNRGIWSFEGIGGKLQVKPAEHADCELNIQALSGLLYGTHGPSDFLLRGWGNPSPHDQINMRQLMPPMTPYLHEFF